MKSLLIAAVVSIAFALFFAAFLILPAIVIAVAYVVMTMQARRRSRRAKAEAEAAKPLETKSTTA